MAFLRPCSAKPKREREGVHVSRKRERKKEKRERKKEKTGTRRDKKRKKKEFLEAKGANYFVLYLEDFEVSSCYFKLQYFTKMIHKHANTSKDRG